MPLVCGIRRNVTRIVLLFTCTFISFREDGISPFVLPGAFQKTVFVHEGFGAELLYATEHMSTWLPLTLFGKHLCVLNSDQSRLIRRMIESLLIRTNLVILVIPS